MAVNDIRDMLKGQQGAGPQPQSVSVTRTLSLAERTLTHSLDSKQVSDPNYR